MKVENQEVNITMRFYKNISVSSKTFYGVTFRPGEIHGVDGNINHPKMIQVDGPSDMRKAPHENDKTKVVNRPAKPKVVENKETEKVEEKGENE